MKLQNSTSNNPKKSSTDKTQCSSLPENNTMYKNPMKNQQRPTWSRHFMKVILLGSCATYLTLQFMKASKIAFTSDQLPDYEITGSKRVTSQDEMYKEDWAFLQKQVESGAAASARESINSKPWHNPSGSK